MSWQYNIIDYLPCTLSLDGFDRVHMRDSHDALARVCLASPQPIGRLTLQDFYGVHADLLGDIKVALRSAERVLLPDVRGERELGGGQHGALVPCVERGAPGIYNKLYSLI